MLAGDPAARRHDVAVSFADADRADYTREEAPGAPSITVMPEVYERLGLKDTGPHMILLRAGDLDALSGE